MSARLHRFSVNARIGQMTLYLTKDGQKLGPYSFDQIQIFLKQGLVTTSDQVWAEGWAS